MGICASKPKTKDDEERRQRQPETPRNRKLIGTGGQSTSNTNLASSDNADNDTGPSLAYIHVDDHAATKRQAKLDMMLMAADPADFERDYDERLIDKIVEEETYSQTNASTSGGLSEKEIQLRKEQINALSELERHLEDDIISTLESRASETRRSESVSPSKLKHPFLVDADNLVFPVAPRHGGASGGVESAESISDPIIESNVEYNSPNFVQQFKHESIESFKLYAPEDDSGNAHTEADTDIESESSLTESMQVSCASLFKLNHKKMQF